MFLGYEDEQKALKSDPDTKQGSIRLSNNLIFRYTLQTRIDQNYIGVSIPFLPEANDDVLKHALKKVSEEFSSLSNKYYGLAFTMFDNNGRVFLFKLEWCYDNTFAVLAENAEQIESRVSDIFKRYEFLPKYIYMTRAFSDMNSLFYV